MLWPSTPPISAPSGIAPQTRKRTVAVIRPSSGFGQSCWRNATPVILKVMKTTQPSAWSARAIANRQSAWYIGSASSQSTALVIIAAHIAGFPGRTWSRSAP